MLGKVSYHFSVSHLTAIWPEGGRKVGRNEYGHCSDGTCNVEQFLLFDAVLMSCILKELLRAKSEFSIAMTACPLIPTSHDNHVSHTCAHTRTAHHMCSIPHCKKDVWPSMSANYPITSVTSRERRGKLCVLLSLYMLPSHSELWDYFI
jgi:hypothetical protein